MGITEIFLNYYQYFLRGTQTTVIVSLITVLLGTVLGCLIALLRLSKFRLCAGFAKLYITVIRGTPLLVQLYIVYYQLHFIPWPEDDTYYGQPAEGDATFEVAAGDFDLRGFEVTNASLFDANKRPYVLFQSKQIKFSTDCVRQFGKDNKVELLIHPGLRKLAVRRASKDSRQFVQWSRPDDGKYYVKEIPCSAFGETLFELLGWETAYKFKAYGSLLESDGDSLFLFDLSEPAIFIQSYLMTGTDAPGSGNSGLSPLSVSGKRIRAVPKKLADRFGSDFYSHRLTASSLELQSEDAWKLWLEGQLFETSEKLHVTKFDEMQRFINEQLSASKQLEGAACNA